MENANGTFCSTTKIAVPVRLRSANRISVRRWIMDGCNPSEISSIIMRRGEPSSARETISIFCSPPLRVPAFWLRRFPTMGKYSLPPAHPFGKAPIVAEAEPEIVLYCQVLEQRLLLGGVGNGLARDQMGGQGRDVLPEQLDPAPLGREEAEYRLEESALAHAVLAKQGKDFAGPDAERDIAQYHA